MTSSNRRMFYRKHVVTTLVMLVLPVMTSADPVAPGFPNIPQTPGAILSGLNAPNQGRTAILAYHNGLLFTVPEQPSSAPGSDFEVRVWDISDPVNPVVTQELGITPQPVNAHGYLKSGDYLVIGSNWPPDTPWSFRADGPGNLIREEFPDLLCIGVRGCLFQPWFVGDTYWSYGEVEGDASLELRGETLATWDHLGQTGVIGHPFLIGDLLIFASDQSRTGVATYDVSDPSNPVLLDVLTTGGPGGYWPELWGGEGKLYVVFPYRTGGNGFRVVDVTDPSDLRFLTDTTLPGESSAQYIQFQDEFAFMGGHKVDMRTFESVLFLDGWNTTRPNDGGVGIDTSQFLLPLGNLLITGGIEPYQGMAIWAHQAEPDTRGPYVGYHIPQAGRTNYPVGAPISLLIHETLETPTIVNGVSFIVRPLGGSPISGRLTFAFDDVLTFTPDAPLEADTTYEVIIPAGGIKDAAGNGITGTSFTFSTGSAVDGNQPPAISSFNVAHYPVAPGASTTLSATASDPDGDPLEYRFDFGDGSPKTAWAPSTSVTASWAEAGHYRVGVQVRDPTGVIVSESFTVTVIIPQTGPMPAHSSQIACDDSSRRILAVNPDNNTLAAVNADTLAKEFEVSACADPRSVARAATGELWLACHDDDSLAVLSATGDLLARLPTGHGSAPSAIVFGPGGTNAFVALQGAGRVERWNAASRLRTGSLDLGPRPSALAISGDGSQLLITRLLSPKDHAEVWNVDPTTLTLSSTIRVPKFGEEENHDGTASGRGVANYLRSIVFTPDNQSAWVAANKPNTERGPYFGPDLDPDNTVRNVIFQVDVNDGSVIRAIDLDNSDSASAIGFSPLGDYLIVTLQGNNQIAVLDALEMGSLTGLGSLVGRLGTGLAPQGVCTDPVTERIFVKSLMGRSVSALDAGPLFRRGSLAVPETEVSTVASETLAPEVLTGKQIFYNADDERMSDEGYLSCASCHLDGGQDGRVWDFNGRGEGFRNTISLRGRAGMEHGNVHWTANFDEIQDFEGDVRNGFGGRGFLDDGDWNATREPLGPPKAGLNPDLDALAAYVASLGPNHLPRSPYRDAAGNMTAEAQAGATIFTNLGCTNCHADERFTDSELGPDPLLHDVGTLRTTSGQRLGEPLPGIDTPTLLGLWNTSPYFHDGSAPTLSDVFVVAGGEVIQAEDASVSGDAILVDEYVDLNNDSSVHGEAYVYFDGPSARLIYTSVDGGSGGTGAIEVRYSVGFEVEMRIRVNGVAHTLMLPELGNDPFWRHTNWGRARLENVGLASGATNTIELFPADPTQGFPDISIDDVTISTSDELSRAQPHRQVLNLSTGERDALLAYLRQLEGPPEAGPELIFRDSFESGDTSAWSSETTGSEDRSGS